MSADTIEFHYVMVSDLADWLGRGWVEVAARARRDHGGGVVSTSVWRRVERDGAVPCERA